MHSKTVDSYQQLAKLLSMNYVDYDGVITPQIQKDLSAAINCYERVFKFMKTHRQQNGLMKSKSGVLKGSKDTMLLSLTRTLIGLKLRLIPSQHKEVLRSIRKEEPGFTERAVKGVILRMVHLTPTVYLTEIFQRLDDGDQSAIEELGLVVQIAESSNLSIA